MRVPDWCGLHNSIFAEAANPRPLSRDWVAGSLAVRTRHAADDRSQAYAQIYKGCNGARKSEKGEKDEQDEVCDQVAL
jgi:hypothetical protein